MYHLNSKSPWKGPQQQSRLHVFPVGHTCRRPTQVEAQHFILSAALVFLAATENSTTEDMIFPCPGCAAYGIRNQHEVIPGQTKNTHTADSAPTEGRKLCPTCTPVPAWPFL